MVVTDPRLDVAYLALASDAAAGKPRGWPWGTSTNPWNWWWRETLLAVAVVAALTMLWVRRLQRGGDDVGVDPDAPQHHR
jgi:hypothetical protein